MDRDRLIKVMDMVAEDVKNDAAKFDGKPFNGRTMAEYMGNHGAAIAVIAETVKEILLEWKGSPLTRTIW